MKHRRLLAALLTAAVAAAQLALPAGSGSAAAPASAAFVSWSLQTNEVTQLAPGVTQTVGTYTLDGSVSNYWRISFTKDSGAKLRVVLPNDGTSTGLDTVRHMADSAVLHGENVVAAVNGDMYNMSTGEPWGVVYREGQLLHGNNVAGRDWDFVGYGKDGSLLGGSAADFDRMWPQLDQAMGLHMVLVENGANVCSDASATRAPRTAIGMRSDGEIFLVAVDGRSSASAGLSLTEMADLMVKLGAVWAGNLDGGGSTTVVSREVGADALSVQNSPSDGSERRVANAWLITVPGSPTQAQIDASDLAVNGRVVSDTTAPLTLRPGQSYQFRMTVQGGSGAPNCFVDDASRFRVTYTGSSGRDYFFRVTALSASSGSVGVYTQLPGGSAERQCTLNLAA